MSGQEDVSDLKIGEFICHNGSNIEQHLELLWHRTIYSLCILNVDEYLRNYGFILKESSWKSSPAYDINPLSDGYGLKLNISESDYSQDYELASSVIKHFRLEQIKAFKIIYHVKNGDNTLKTWYFRLRTRVDA
ncbi:MAG: HipA domain-containing protein [Alcanivoracaceae bacterium]|nr:HipA domain-containing protein [Alcanivoracaceae bacterium]